MYPPWGWHLSTKASNITTTALSLDLQKFIGVRNLIILFLFYFPYGLPLGLDPRSIDHWTSLGRVVFDYFFCATLLLIIFWLVRVGRDKEKTLGCKEKGIRLVEIPYWWDNSQESLKELVRACAPDLVTV